MASRLEIIIAGSTQQLESALRGAKASTQRFGKALNAASVAGGAALLALGAGAKVGFDEFKQGELVAAQTAAVIKSTGGAAGITATQIDGLATSLMRKSGMDDEAIKSGANLLLTFTNLKNQAGKGNDVFNETTRTMVDMSTALGQDTKASAIQLGKALNDPIKGVSALSKVGVSFTQDQKDQIKTLVESGNVMGAQKVILAELGKEFGGSAAAAGGTFTGKLNIAKESAKNLAGQLVAAAIPALTALVGVFSKATSFMASHTTTAKVLIGVIGGLSAVVLVTNAALKAQAAITAIVGAAKLAFTTTTATATAATAAQTGAQTALNGAMRANPIGIVITAIALLAAGIVVAYKKSETFRAIVGAAFDVVKNAVSGVRDAVGWVIDKVGALVNSKAVKVLGGILAAPFEFAMDSINKVIDAIKRVIDLAGRAAGAIKHGFTGGTDPSKTDILNPSLRVPKMAHGGIVTRPTIALIGEAGDEAVVPLPGGRAGGLGGVTQVFNFPNYVGDKADLIEMIRTELIRGGRRMPGVLGGLA